MVLRDVDQTWFEVLRAFGFRVTRERGSYVAYDGNGAVNIVPDDELDGDDSIAQVVLHELCHYFCQGADDARGRPDWGLDNTSGVDVGRERATLRLQAAVADRFGLRNVLVPTTEHRAFYESLGGDPLGEDPIAADGLRRRDAHRCACCLDVALEATARLVAEGRK